MTTTPEAKLPMRDKYWSEMDSKEKIEKLLHELERTQDHLRDVSKMVSQLVNHDHSNNRIVTKIVDYDEEYLDRLNFRIYEKE